MSPILLGFYSSRDCGSSILYILYYLFGTRKVYQQMKRLKHSKLFVIEYSFDTRRPTFILADNIEDALKDHKSKFPNYHRNLKIVQFITGQPMFTDKVAKREFEDVINEIKPKPKELEIEDEPKTIEEIIERESR